MPCTTKAFATQDDTNDLLATINRMGNTPVDQQSAVCCRQQNPCVPAAPTSLVCKDMMADFILYTALCLPAIISSLL